MVDKKIIDGIEREEIIPNYSDCPNCETRLYIKKDGTKLCLKCGTTIEPKT